MATNILTQVHEDMIVFDSMGERIGTVNAVQFGDEDPHNATVEAVTDVRPKLREDAIIDQLASVFKANQGIADELRARLNRYGYIEVSRSLPGLGSYIVSADQIAAVQANQVKLQTKSDELITIGS